jgi:hypothetical protein
MEVIHDKRMMYEAVNLPLKVIKPVKWFFFGIRREPRQRRDRRRNFDLRCKSGVQWLAMVSTPVKMVGKTATCLAMGHTAPWKGRRQGNDRC